VAAIEISGPAEPEINWYEHQSRTMRDRYGKGPKSELRRAYPQQRSRMAPVDEPEHTVPDEQKTGADLDLLLPVDERDQQREGKNHQEHRGKVADRQWPKRRDEGARAFLHQAS
jgi:hypothetical protein